MGSILFLASMLPVYSVYSSSLSWSPNVTVKVEVKQRVRDGTRREELDKTCPLLESIAGEPFLVLATVAFSSLLHQHIQL